MAYQDIYKILASRLHGIKKRCYNKNCRSYKNYGERGIIICDEWKNDYKKFYQWSLDNGFQPNLQLDRIDNDGPYSPENCRFVTRKQNCRNKRTNKLVTFNNKTQTVIEWSEELNINYKILRNQIGYNWSFNKIINKQYLKIQNQNNVKKIKKIKNKKFKLIIRYEYNNQFKTLKEWSKILKINYYTLNKRIIENNYKFNNAIINPVIYKATQENFGSCDVNFQKVNFNGETLTLYHWAKKLNLKVEDIIKDFKNGKSIETIFSQSV